MVEQNIDWTAAWKELESGGAEKQHLAVGTQKTMSDFYKWWSRYHNFNSEVFKPRYNRTSGVEDFFVVTLPRWFAYPLRDQREVVILSFLCFLLLATAYCKIV